jgi:hypothetical protein
MGLVRRNRTPVRRQGNAKSRRSRHGDPVPILGRENPETEPAAIAFEFVDLLNPLPPK